MIAYLIKIMSICLTLTILIELIIALFLKVRDKLDLINILFANIITNPLVVTIPLYINLKFGLLERNITLLILEIFTVLLEGRLYKKYLKFNKINPYTLSLILNLSSYFIGEIINKILY